MQSWDPSVVSSSFLMPQLGKLLDPFPVDMGVIYQNNQNKSIGKKEKSHPLGRTWFVMKTHKIKDTHLKANTSEQELKVYEHQDIRQHTSRSEL